MLARHHLDFIGWSPIASVSLLLQLELLLCVFILFGRPAPDRPMVEQTKSTIFVPRLRLWQAKLLWGFPEAAVVGLIWQPLKILIVAVAYCTSGLILGSIGGFLLSGCLVQANKKLVGLCQVLIGR